MKASITLREVLHEHANTTYDITERLFHRVTDEELAWVPTAGKNWMTMGQLLMHCAGFGCGKAIQGFVKGDWGLPDAGIPDDPDAAQHVPPSEVLPCVESVEQALELLAEDRSLALRCIDETQETDLLTKRLVAPWGGAEVSLFQHLLLMIEHLDQHKGQLFYYLKFMGNDVNTSDLWGA
ncbi:MAG: DinB family protein [Bacteroidota bacterium]